MNFQELELGQSVNGGLVPVPNLRDVNLGQSVNGGFVPETKLQDVDLNQRMTGGGVLGRNMRDREPIQPIHNKFIPVTNLRAVKLKDNGDNQTKVVGSKEPSTSILPLPGKDDQGRVIAMKIYLKAKKVHIYTFRMPIFYIFLLFNYQRRK